MWQKLDWLFCKENVKKISWYIVIGLFTFVMTNVLLYVCRGLLQMSDGLAVAISYAVVTLCHFLLHNNLTFRGSKQPLRDKLRGHMVVSAVNYLAGTTTATAVLKCIVDDNLVATTCSTAVTFLLGFTLLNRFVYKMNDEGGRKK